MTDGEGLLPFLAQLQPVGPARLFLGHKAVFHQLGNAALRISPVQSQRLGQLAWTAARVLAHIEDQEQRAEVEAQRLKLPGGISGEATVEERGIVGKGSEHTGASNKLTFSSAADILDKVKYKNKLFPLKNLEYRNRKRHETAKNGEKPYTWGRKFDIIN